MGSLLVKLLAKFFAGKSYLWNSRESLCPNIVTELYLRNFLRVSLTCENTQKTCFSLKTIWNFFEKHGWYKSPPKANKKNKKLFDLIHIWLSTHTSHLNIYNHTNEISIHWTLDLCIVCVYIKCGIVLSLEWSFNDHLIKSYTTSTKSSGLSQL